MQNFNMKCWAYRNRMTVGLIAVGLGAFLENRAGTAQESTKQEVVRTQYGSEFSDGSSTIAGHSATFTEEKGSVVLKIDSTRPVERAAETFQSRYGYVISYEDPLYTYEDDLQDDAPKIVRDYSRYAPGTAPKLMGPKGGQLTLRLPASSSITSDELATALRQLVEAQASSHQGGGHFRVEQAGDVFHVIPTEVRDRNGNWARYSSPLDAPISLPVQDRSEKELYRAIAEAASAATGVSIHAMVNGGIVTGPLLPEPRFNVGAIQERARDVLLRALQLHPTRQTWALRCGPGWRYACVLNIGDLPTHSQAQPSAVKEPAQAPLKPTTLAAPDPSNCATCAPKR
jgi:hypothetical protein